MRSCSTVLQYVRVSTRGKPRLLLASAALLLLGAAAACHSGTEPRGHVCRPAGEFGTYGCAAVAVRIAVPAVPLSVQYLLDLRTVSTNVNDPQGFVPYPQEGLNTLWLTLFASPLAHPGDTVSLWVRASMLDNHWPPPIGVPLPVLTADSVLHVFRFVREGSEPPIDTIALTLRLH